MLGVGLGHLFVFLQGVLVSEGRLSDQVQMRQLFVDFIFN